MGNFCVNKLFNNFTLCTITSALLASSVVSPYNALYSCEKGFNITLNDIAFIARLEKLYEKAKKYIDRLEYDKLIDVMLDLKTEVQGYTGIEIDIEKTIDAIEKEAKKHDIKFKKGEIKQVKKYIKKKSKKHLHKAMFMYECSMYGIKFTQEECDLHFDTLCKKKDTHPYTKEENEIHVPIRVSIGITAALCGYFLNFIPHPFAQNAAQFLVTTGLALCLEGTVNSIEEDEKED